MNDMLLIQFLLMFNLNLMQLLQSGLRILCCKITELPSEPAKMAPLVLPNRFCPFSAKWLPPVRGALLKRAVKGHKLSKGTLN